jgi:hypothetical protein
MDLSELIKSYSPEQKNVFSGFCIQLPLIFTIMYLYIPAFKLLELYLQIIFSISASIISIYYSFSLLCLCATCARYRFKMEIPILIIPILTASYILLHSPENYSNGHEHILKVMFKCTSFFYGFIGIFGFFYRKCIDYDIKSKWRNKNKIH